VNRIFDKADCRMDGLLLGTVCGGERWGLTLPSGMGGLESIIGRNSFRPLSENILAESSEFVYNALGCS
jgi:hypothetical protein